MALVKSPKGFTGIPVLPKSISSIVVSVGGLALFLIFASWLLISYPVGPTVHGYLFTGSGSSPLFGPNNNSKNESVILLPRDSPPDMDDKIPSSGSVFSNFSSSEEITQPILPGLFNGSQSVEGGEMGVETEVNDKTPDSASNKTEEISLPSPPLSIGEGETGVETGASDKTPDSSSNKTQEISMPSPPLSQNPSKTDSGGCDLYHGNWFFDSSGPLYTNNTCPIITQMQNCQGNGRPDKDYESWRWKPSQCVLPRFDAKKFLELMRGKTLAFIGDSVARNQMESMLCLLWQVEVPKNRGNRHMQRWFFKSTSVMIVRIWSSWLVHQTSDPFDFAPKGVSKLHLDAPDEGFMEFLPKFDVVVLSSGHWFAKQSVYILNNEIVGGQLWWPDKSRPMKVNNIEAFGISTETILTAISTYPNYTGLTIVRSFSPDHYEGGAWNTGGSCTGKVKPATELVENGFTNIMHEKQVTGFNRAVQKSNNGSKLRLMDITEAFGYRHDGHPGPFRNPDPNKKTKRGPHGEPPPQDCLHWCMPGPVDTWNEIVLEIIHREYGDSETSPA